MVLKEKLVKAKKNKVSRSIHKKNVFKTML